MTILGGNYGERNAEYVHSITLYKGEFGSLTLSEKNALTFEELKAYEPLVESPEERKQLRTFKKRARERERYEQYRTGSARQRYESLQRRPDHKHLSSGTRSVFDALYSSARVSDGVTSPTVAELIEATGLGRATVKRAIKNLCERGYITRLEGEGNGEGGRGNPSIYQLGTHKR
ncbi:MarR family transcriptional regulator [Aquisalimonas asiatica]|uniref:Winged helix-turn-helix DNA-binding n=1 Tax=Aquisalimonas asiatica TaxID=406100 RepID=A0A1H8UCX0_9GAMM|nr:MarR family transcriptional regulator [Aquisalimonas asiatica]SEP00877.1 Winged helix-turn-helix DNA-binding [Aquisalimonas asiatica]